jgi:hypothetical protein
MAPKAAPPRSPAPTPRATPPASAPPDIPNRIEYKYCTKGVIKIYTAEEVILLQDGKNRLERITFILKVTKFAGKCMHHCLLFF